MFYYDTLLAWLHILPMVTIVTVVNWLPTVGSAGYLLVN